MGYIAYKLTEESRRAVLERFPPRYPEVRADHVTVAFGVAAGTELPPAARLEITGHTDDRNGIEALVVRVNGQALNRDGKAYHLTLSFDPHKTAPAAFDPRGRALPYRSVHSNGLIEALGYREVAPFAIEAVSGYFEESGPRRPAGPGPGQ